MVSAVRAPHVPRLASESTSYGEVLDECGNYICYGESVNSPEMRGKRGLPEGLVEGCKLKRNIAASSPQEVVVDLVRVLEVAQLLEPREGAELVRVLRHVDSLEEVVELFGAFTRVPAAFEAW